MPNHINIRHWLDARPSDQHRPSDAFYVKLANQIFNKSEHVLNDLQVNGLLKKDELIELSCLLAAWIEDLVSGTGIYAAFVGCHERLYGKPIPYYFETGDEYFHGEPNKQDIKFLTWYYLNIVYYENLFYPSSKTISTLAERLEDLLGDAYEIAPENEGLRNEILLPLEPEHFFMARFTIERVLMRSYLFVPDTTVRIKDELMDLQESMKDLPQLEIVFYDHQVNCVLSKRTRLLAMSGADWVYEMLGPDCPYREVFLDISKSIKGCFEYKEEDDDSIHMEHVASGKMFIITKKSLDDADWAMEDSLWYLTIIRWQDEWWQNGMAFSSKYEADTVLDLKNSASDRASVAFLDAETERYKESMDHQYKDFLRFNNGRPIAFMSSDKVDDFIQRSIDHFNDSLGLSARAQEESRARMRAEGLFEEDGSIGDFGFENNKTTDVVIFFNPDSGYELVSGLSSAFPFDDNPYYNDMGCMRTTPSLIVDPNCSPSFAKYALEIGREENPYFAGKGKELISDFDFLLRYFKYDRYQAKKDRQVFI